jgi:hypothetical protein
MIDRIVALILIPMAVTVLCMSRQNLHLLTRLRQLPRWLRVPTVVFRCVIGAVVLAGIGVAIGLLP